MLYGVSSDIAFLFIRIVCFACTVPIVFLAIFWRGQRGGHMKVIAMLAIGSMMASGAAFAAAPVSGVAKPTTEIKKEGGAPVQLVKGSKKFIHTPLPFGRKGV